MASKIELPRYIQVGSTADIGLVHTQSVLRNVGLNPDVVVDFNVGRDCTVCGVESSLSLLGEVLPENGSEVWGVKEGTKVNAGDTILKVRAPFASFVTYQSSICGFLSTASGWATAANECVEASGSKSQVIASCAYAAHPSIVADVEYAAVKGGCVSVSTPLAARIANLTPTSVLSTSLIMILGSLGDALDQFEEAIPAEVTRIARMGVLQDEVNDVQAIKTKKTKERISRFFISPPAGRGPVTINLVNEVRAHLKKSGQSDVDILIAGGLNPTIIRDFTAKEAPVAAYVVGYYIASAAPIGVSSDVVEIDGKEVTRRGVIPSTDANLSLERIL